MPIDPNGKLEGVHPDLVKIVLKANEYLHIPALVFEGVRTVERERMLIAQGKSSLSDPYLCRHVPLGTPPYSRAVDIVPLIKGKPTWADSAIPLYTKIVDAMKVAADELKIPLRQGAKWQSFRDWPHHELPRTYVK